MALVLVIGGGGREHALCCVLARSPSVEKVLVAPGNPGMAAEDKVRCVVLDTTDHQAVVRYCRAQGVGLVVVGPEAPLAAGITDALQEEGVKVFGPSRAAAAIEADKQWAKKFMARHGISTARWQAFTDPAAAKQFIQQSSWGGWAVKAAGLAGGKGVVVAGSKAAAVAAVDELLSQHAHAAQTLLVEERLNGYELSVMCLSDGESVAMLLPTQDHKGRYEHNEGPNTGGMGAVCPYPLDEPTREACEQILKKTVRGMAEEGRPFVGLLYAGVMVGGSDEGHHGGFQGPRVLEFNCRFGDPETQAVLHLLQSDLYTAMMACVDHRLKDIEPIWFQPDQFACAVSVVTHSYPKTADKGLPIEGLASIEAFQPSCPPRKVYHSGTAAADGVLVTSGGRVVTVVAAAADAAVACAAALEGARMVGFTGASCRVDIGHQALNILNDSANTLLVGNTSSTTTTTTTKTTSSVTTSITTPITPATTLTTPATTTTTYASAGVDVAVGEEFVAGIRACVQLCNRATHGALVLGGIGGFAGLFDLHGAGFTHPVLVAGTDGVGTKLMVAQAMGQHRGVGQDLVAMCLNDVLCHGARPLFFLDYLATGRLDAAVLTEVVEGIAEACQHNGLALIGGETAEMPGLYRPGEYDVAGFAMGCAEKAALLPRCADMRCGHHLVAIPSSGLHSNGFSLVRKIVHEMGFSYTDPLPYDDSKTIGEVLLTSTRIYTEVFRATEGRILGAAHITGGGVTGNAGRMLPGDLTALLDATKWRVPDIFLWLAAHGVSAEEMAKTFNLGIGLILVVTSEGVAEVLQALQGHHAFIVGELVDRAQGSPAVVIQHLESEWAGQLAAFKTRHPTPSRPLTPPVRLAVIISGRGSNMQSVVRAVQQPRSGVDVVLVLCNNPGAEGLAWAGELGIKTQCVNHRDYKERRLFEEEMQRHLVAAGTEFICLAGFMRILTEGFVSQWKDRLINVHPSLLPSFKGKDAQKQALEAKVKITGCTVHFVETAVDSGEILAQAAVEVLEGDTVETLSGRIIQQEHIILPRAVLAVGRGLRAPSSPSTKAS